MTTNTTPAAHAGGYGLSTATYRDIAMRQFWQHPTGDWLDANGVVNGSAPTIAANGPSATVDISALPAELYVQGGAITAITIDGQPADCYWTRVGSGSGFRLPSSGDPVIVMQAGGKSMTITGKGPWRIDSLYLLPVLDYAPVGDRTDPDILSVDFSSLASITAKATGQQPSPIIPGAYEFGNYNGMNYVRVCNDAAFDGRVIGAQYPFPTLLTEAYCGYALYIEDDVWDAVNDLGIKLSGFSMKGSDPRDAAGAWSEGEQSGYYSGKKQPLNRGIFGLDHYTRDADTGSGAITEKANARALMASGRWYWLERYVKMNTPGAQDGIEREWINGNLICDQKRKWSLGSGFGIYQFHLQLYHGGVNKWIGPAHYRIGQVEVASHYIGVPPALRAAATIPTQPSAAEQLAAAQSALTAAQGQLASAQSQLNDANAKVTTLQGRLAQIETIAAG